MKTSEFAAKLDQVSVTAWQISDEKVHWLDPNNAVISYKWTGTGTFQGQQFPSPVTARRCGRRGATSGSPVFHRKLTSAQLKVAS